MLSTRRRLEIGERAADAAYRGRVNFLLHRRLAARDLGSEVAGVGGMLPDLWRMADRRVRPARGEVLSDGEHDAALEPLLRGIAHHVEADRWFHAAPVFVDGERALIAAIRERSFAATRLPLFAHVLWEMCLDGALLRRDGLETTLTAVRRGFDESDGSSSERAATLHHFARHERSDEERSGFDRRLARIRHELARGPWIEGYADGEGIADRLTGVRLRVGLEALGADDRRCLAAMLDDVAPAADDAVDRILAYRPAPRTA